MSDLPTFERFLEAVRGTNPFRSTRVTDPGRSEGDVASIHQAQFEKMTKAVETVGKDPVATGVLLLGAAGVGKSHLLARLFRWASEDRATVVYLHNILASPERMFRYVINATISDLGSHRGAFAESRLYQLITRAMIREAGGAKPQDREAHSAALSRMMRRLDPGGSIGTVLSFFRDAASSKSSDQPNAEARARAALHWLAGETLGPDEANLIGKVAPEEGIALADDAVVDQIFHILSKICALAQRPLVLCLDQVDNLDAPGVTALTAMAQALIDRGKNLLVVVSGVKETLLRLKQDGIISQASWDRIAERIVELNRISPEEAHAVLEGRLEPMLTAFREVDRVAGARRKDSIFPLGSAWFREKQGDIPEFRPRDVVMWARDRWEQQQALLEKLGGERWFNEWEAAQPQPAKAESLDALIDEEVKKKLLEGVNRRKLEPFSLPPNEDNLATLARTLLAHCVGDSRYTLTGLNASKPSRKTPAYQLLAQERRADGLNVTSGITFVTAPSGHGSRWALARIVEDAKPPTHRILVTDEDRRPLKLAKASGEHYAQLCKLGKRGFLHIKLSFEAYAELDSISALIGEARGGDLEIEYPRGVARAVTEEEALSSLHRTGRFLAHPLLREMLTEETSTVSDPPIANGNYDEKRAREHIIAELSWRLGLMARELAQTFIGREKIPERLADHIWAKMKETAQGLHQEGHVYAHAQDDDLFLQFRKKSE